MDKAQYIQEIVKLLEQCNDVDFIELVYQIVLKASA